MNNLNIGEINGHIVGRILKETVRRAIFTIRNERLVFEATEKQGYSGNMDDVFTSADTKAQKIYLRAFSECFPNCGVIGEEDYLVIEPKGTDAYFTVDPLDGTKAYVRRQSHGIGTMVSLVLNVEIISAYIGDINTEEIYGYRPDSESVHRITKMDIFEVLNDYDNNFDIKSSAILLREPAHKYSELSKILFPNLKLMKLWVLV